MSRAAKRHDHFFERVTYWWQGPRRLEKAHVHISQNGVLSKSSEEILKSEAARQQLDSFVELHEERAQETACK